MKKIAKTTIAIIVILSLLVVAPVNKAKAQFSASISIQAFYNELRPYGQWIDDPEYGYVWIPDADPGFRPYYSRGHWVMTRYGTMWVSDYSWGWAPFHYGRWVFSSYYGDWVWIPDTEWGPAWVSWRWGGGYCGWAPLGPGISISLSFGPGSYLVPNDWWVFIPAEHCLSASFYNYRFAPERNVTYINNTTIINNTYVNNNVTYVAGPRTNDLEKVTHNKVQVYNINDAKGPGKASLQGNAVNVYHPQVTKSFQGNSKPVPPSVITRDQFKKNNTRVEPGPGKQNDQPSRTIDKPVNNNKPVNQNNKPVNQPSRTIEKKQVQQENMPVRNNNKPVNQNNKPVNQPSQPIERKQIEPQNNKPVNQPIERKQVEPQNNKPVNQPIERKQVEPQNNKPVNQPIERKQVEPQNNKPVNQPIERKQVEPQNNKPVNQSPQQTATQSKPVNKGNGKKGNN